MTLAKIISGTLVNYQEATELSQTFESSMQDAKDTRSSSRAPRVGQGNAVTDQKAEYYWCGRQYNHYKCKNKSLYVTNVLERATWPRSVINTINWGHTNHHILRVYGTDTDKDYCIAGNFQGRKFSR